jgi:hypothetical protein
VRRVFVTLALLLATVSAGAQIRRGRPILANPDYDGQFTFVRLAYGPDTTHFAQQIPWSHDYPTGERHFMQILHELTYLHPKIEETAILTLDDPNLFKYPVAYMAEPGYWSLTESEAKSFREYLLKGGFVIFDDFAERRGGWANFAFTFQRLLPGAKFYDLTPQDPIFHAFFEVPSFDIVPQAYDIGRPVFRAVYEDNDPKKRMVAMINFNTDISEYWEFSGTGYRPVSETNEAYKLGVNYVIYGMTH